MTNNSQLRRTSNERRGSIPLFGGGVDRDPLRSSTSSAPCSVTTWPFANKDNYATQKSSFTASHTASLSSLLSSMLNDENMLDDKVTEDVWVEFKAELDARNLKTGLGVQGLL